MILYLRNYFELKYTTKNTEYQTTIKRYLKYEYHNSILATGLTSVPFFPSPNKSALEIELDPWYLSSLSCVSNSLQRKLTGHLLPSKSYAENSSTKFQCYYNES